MKLVDYLKEIELFISDYLKTAHSEKIILGLSGGVDSSLVCGLAKSAVGKENLICVMMPIESNPSDLEDAIAVAKALDVNYIVLDGSEAFNASKREFDKNGVVLDKATLSNLKVRIRMSYLYALAQKEHGLVIGTDNKDERYVGYFTKFGDGAADLLPIVHLTKNEVVEAAKIYGVPDYLAERVPSAGLFEGQTDEIEMGIKYADLDRYLIGGEVSPDVQIRIEYLHRISEHKREPIPTPKEYIRD